MTTIQYVKLVTGSLLFAAVCYVILAAPGFLSDDASTLSLHGQETMVQR